MVIQNLNYCVLFLTVSSVQSSYNRHADALPYEHLENSIVDLSTDSHIFGLSVMSACHIPSGERLL